MNSNNQLIVKVSRDSVCAGDDMYAHEAKFLTKDNISLAQIIEQAIKACPLASISGGKATWVICAPEMKSKYIGVIAQEWKEPKFVVASETNAEIFFGSKEIKIDFVYWCQVNPSEVFEAVENGSELPNV